jgi:hypothetical protein
LELGAVKYTLALPLPINTLPIVGAPGVVVVAAGVTLTELDVALLPLALVA